MKKIIATLVLVTSMATNALPALAESQNELRQTWLNAKKFVWRPMPRIGRRNWIIRKIKLWKMINA